MSINIDDLTTGTVDGTGIFDILMKAVGEHLENEFKANRIKGNDYATVYTGLMGSAMQVAASYATTKAVADQQVLNLIAEGLNIPKQGLVLDKQVEVSDAQIAQIAAETVNVPKQGELLDSQVLASEAQVALINQKKITEDAQTQEDVADPDSVIGKQLTLYQNQADGYIQDAKVKTAGLYKDILAVQLNINENITTAGTGFENAAIKLVLDAARNGVGAIGNVTAPTITLIDPGSVSTPQGTPYTDPGATAIDESGVAVTVSVSGTVDHTTVGSYNLVYSATDSNGLTGNATRTVEVI